MMDTDAVVLGSRGATLTFDEPSADGTSVRATLRLDQVWAQMIVDLNHPDQISDYLAELDREWRGWAGDISWGNGDVDFLLTARHDGVREIRIHVQMHGRWDIDDLERREWSASGWLSMEVGAIGRVEAALRMLMSSGPATG
jgi:hypothetical protein